MIARTIYTVPYVTKNVITVVTMPTIKNRTTADCKSSNWLIIAIAGGRKNSPMLASSQCDAWCIDFGSTIFTLNAINKMTIPHTPAGSFTGKSRAKNSPARQKAKTIANCFKIFTRIP